MPSDAPGRLFRGTRNNGGGYICRTARHTSEDVEYIRADFCARDATKEATAEISRLRTELEQLRAAALDASPLREALTLIERLVAAQTEGPDGMELSLGEVDQCIEDGLALLACVNAPKGE